MSISLIPSSDSGTPRNPLSSAKSETPSQCKLGWDLVMLVFPVPGVPVRPTLSALVTVLPADTPPSTLS